MKTYTDDDGRRRCHDCDGYVAARARTCQRCINRAEAAADAQAAELAEAERIEAQRAESAQAGAWRRNMLARHISRLLATKSGSAERIAFIDDNPIAGIFR